MAFFAIKAQNLVVSESTSGCTVIGKGLYQQLRISPGPISGNPEVGFRLNESFRQLDSIQPLHELRIRFSVQDTHGLACRMVVNTWKQVNILTQGLLPQLPTASVQYLGSFNHSPVALLRVGPFKVESGKLWVADEFTVEVLWKSDRSQFAKKIPLVQSVESWYQPEQPHVRVKTRVDGVSNILAKAVVEVEPRLDKAQISNLALFYKGHEVAIAVLDKDQSGDFSKADEIVFFGRRPAGDITWLDIYDTTAVFFLTLREGGERARFTQFNGTLVASDTITQMEVRRRFEIDTGYYHLGSSRNVVFSEFNSDIAPFEGYYWQILNAEARGRVGFRYSATPAPNSTMTVEAEYVSSLYAAPNFVPDTRAELSVNGQPTVSRETSTVGRYTISQSIPAEQTIPGVNSVRMFAPGIAEYVGKTGYVSNILLDAITVSGIFLTVLDSGKISGNIPARLVPTAMLFGNSVSAVGFAVDTANRVLYSLKGGGNAVSIRAGISPVDKTWVDDVTGNRMRASVTFDDAVGQSDSVTAFVLAWRETATKQIRITTPTSNSDLEQLLISLPAGVPFVVGSAGSIVSSSVIAKLASLGVTVPQEAYWISAVVNPELVRTRSHSTQSAVGVTLLQETSTSVFVLPPGPATNLFIGNGIGVEIARVERANLVNLASNKEQTDVIYITHKTHRAQAERLAKHRRAFNNVTVRIVDVDDVIDEFGFGHRSPFAVWDFLYRFYAEAPNTKPTSLLIFGNASWDPRIAIPFANIGSKRPDQVPTYGRPSSDYWYGLLDDRTDYAVPELIVGRIPAITEQQGRTIVDKIIFNDSLEYAPWMRRFLFVGGGSELEGLCDIYKDLLSDPFQSGIKFTDPPLCLDTATLCRYEAPPNAGYIIKQRINGGLQWMNFIGHGSTDVFDIVGWDPNELENSGKFGVLATYACQTGAFSNPSTECKNSQYLTEPDKGFAAAVGGTGWAFIETMNYLHYKIHETMRNSTLRAIGDIVYAAKVEFASPNDQNGINTAMQYCILGDPLMRIHIDTTVDVRISNADVTITGSTGSQPTSSDSTTNVMVKVKSSGLGSTVSFPVSLVRKYSSTTDSLSSTLSGICIDGVVSFDLPVLGMVGEHYLTITADPTRVLGDDFSNNVATVTLNVLSRGALVLEPMPHGRVSNSKPEVRIIDGLWNGTDSQTDVHFAIGIKQSLVDALVISGNDIERDGSIVWWKPSTSQALPVGAAWLASYVVDREINDTSAVTWVPITLSASTTDTGEVQASRFEILSHETVVYDSDKNQINLRVFDRPVRVQASGIPTASSSRDSTLLFQIGDVAYVTNRFFRGVNVVLMRTTDTVPRQIRRYDTYFDPDMTPGWHDGTSKDLIKFMRDSVFDTDVVYMFLWLESVTGFIKDTTFQEFVDVMRSYGSTLVDSLKESSSWIYIGRKGAARQDVTEMWKGSPEKFLTLDKPLTFTSAQGSAATAWIGPMRKLRSIRFVNSDKGVLKRVTLRNAGGELDSLDPLEAKVEQWTAQGTQADASYVKVEFGFEREALDEVNPHVGNVFVDYEPADEWLIEPQSVILEPNSVLRADTTQATFTVKNARGRQVTTESVVNIQVSGPNAGQPAYEFSYQLRSLSGAESVPISTTIPSALAEQHATVSTVVNASKRPEMYSFNNNSYGALTVNEDDIPPTISVYADKADVSEGGYVVREPTFEIVVRDNSKLPIEDSSKLLVFVNGDRIKQSTSSNYEFLGTEQARVRYSDNSVRAAMIFKYSLDDGQNNVLVRASDATQNQATLEPSVWVSNESGLGAVVASPNPSSGPTSFSIELKGISDVAPSTFTVYDGQSREVYRENVPLSIGSNTINWSGFSSYGTSVATGMYAFRITVNKADGSLIGNFFGTLIIQR